MFNSFVSIREAKKLAKKKIRNPTFQWLESGAEDNLTYDKNILDLDNIKITPRIFNSVKSNNLNFQFFGNSYSTPVIVAPMGHQTQFHPNGELELAKALNNSKKISSFTTQGRHDFEQICKQYKNLDAIWQIFPFGDFDWIKKQILTAEKLKAVAISLCLDAPVRSHRYDDRETRYDARKFGKFKSNIESNYKHYFEYDWDIIKKIKKITKLPIIPKGILSKTDLKASLKSGADGIWFSNHGGRFFNSGISTSSFMNSIQNEIKEIKKKNKIIIADGGIRRGTDVIKYLCLGANLVAIGRPILYGLIVKGNKGVTQILNIIEDEFYTSCKNGGFKSIKDFKYSRLNF